MEYVMSYTANTRPRKRSGTASWTMVSTGIFRHANVSPRTNDVSRIVTPPMSGATARQTTAARANATATMRGFSMRSSNSPTVSVPASTPAPPAAMMFP